MTKDEALEYCYKHEKQYKADMYLCGENGERQFDCLIELIESDSIKPSEIVDYGIDFG